MKQRIYKLELLTPLFSRGSYDSAEIRAPSIRGQLHHWLRQLGGKASIERSIFGAVQAGFGEGKSPSASKVIVRVANIQGQPGNQYVLPHKDGAAASPKNAYPPGSKFEVHVLERLGGLDQNATIAFERSMECWLLAGGLGLRVTRGAGAFQWDQAPVDLESYRQRLTELVKTAPLRVDILEPAFDSAEEARKTASDTISDAGLASLHYPLGTIGTGRDSGSQRKTSPLRLTVRRIGGKYRLIALWDYRPEVTGNNIKDLEGAIKILSEGTAQSSKKKLGAMLANSNLLR
jgi:CRISPR type III-B/RAMP module RAMP protein Cmr1